MPFATWRQITTYMYLQTSCKNQNFQSQQIFILFPSMHIKVHCKCTKCARFRWSPQGEADTRDGTAFCLCQRKMRKSGYPNLIQSKRHYTMKSTNRVPLLQSESSLYVVRTKISSTLSRTHISSELQEVVDIW